MVVVIDVALRMTPHDMQYGRQAPLIAASFTGRLRYSVASLRYQLASIVAAGPAPYIATKIWSGETFLPGKNPYMISFYILACCVIGFVATVMLKDRSQYDHTREYEEQETVAAEGIRKPAMG